MKTFAIIVLNACAAFALTPVQRTYHPITIAKMAAQDPGHWKGLHTHVELSGVVTFINHEADGDLHVRICDSAKAKGMGRAHCVVAEFIPGFIAVPKLRVGQNITVRGITRFDDENAMHHWWEVHPVEGFK